MKFKKNLDFICEIYYNTLAFKNKCISGCGEVWYRAWFGTKRPWVQVPSLRPQIMTQGSPCVIHLRGCSSSVECKLPKLDRWVRLPSSAPSRRGLFIVLDGFSFEKSSARLQRGFSFPQKAMFAVAVCLQAHLQRFLGVTNL